MLFSTSMVQAELDGRKTMTRRTTDLESINESPDDWEFVKFEDNAKGGLNAVFKRKDSMLHTSIPCRYGRPGDLLWVRETWGVGCRPDPFEGSVDGIEFKADAKFIDDIESLPLHRYEDFDYGNYDKSGWRPSIHMPKAIARIWLQVTDVRVERLQDIREGDAISEGIWLDNGVSPAGYTVHGIPHWPTAKECFAELWKSINGDESWQANPFVWVVSFTILSTTGKPDLNNL